MRKAKKEPKGYHRPGKEKGTTNFTAVEKNVIINLIRDFNIFDNYTDAQLINIISTKIGRPVGQSTFTALKKEAQSKNMIATEWLEKYVKGELIDHYYERIKEVKLVQKYLIIEFLEEAQKPTGKNRYLMNQLAKTIGENSKTLSDLGMSPPVLASLYSMIPRELLDGSMDPIQLEKYIKGLEDKSIEKAINIPADINTESKEKKNDTNSAVESTRDETGDSNSDAVDPLNAETAIFPPIPGQNDNKPNGGTASETATAQGDQPVFGDSC